MNEITMIPIEWLKHHPENPRKDLGDLTELADSIRANGILQNLTVVASNEDPDDDGYARFWVVIGNRRLEAAKMAGLTELPCVLSDMSREEQIATMLQENMQRSDLTVYEQAKGIQMMIDLGFSKDQVSERTGFSKTTIERRLAVATLPDKETQKAVAYGYDLIDLAEIAKIENRKKQKELLGLRVSIDENGGLNTGFLRQQIKNAMRDKEHKKIASRLLPEVQAFAKELTNSNDRWSNKYDRVNSLTVRLEEGATVKKPTDDGNYYYYVGLYEIEIYQKRKKEKHIKTEAEISLEKKQHDAKELNDRMREKRIAFVSSYTPTKTQETQLKAKIMDWVFGGVNKYTNGDFKYTYHSWDIEKFRKMAGIPLEEGRDQNESLLDELNRRNVPKGRALLAWVLCGGVKVDDRQGYVSQYNGSYYKDEDMDEVYKILTEVGYVLSDDEQAWKDGTHEFYRGGQE